MDVLYPKGIGLEEYVILKEKNPKLKGPCVKVDTMNISQV